MSGCQLTIEVLVNFYREREWKFLSPNAQARAKTPLAVLVRKMGRELVSSFGPIAFKEIRSALMNGVSAKRGEFRHRSAITVNQQMGKIIEVWRWGVEEEVVEERLWRALCAVRKLPRNSAKKVKPVEEDVVNRTIAVAKKPLGDMIRLQWLTGMRSANLCTMRWDDIDRSGPVWLYTPRHHKSEHRDRSMVIPLGPQCQEILAKYTSRPRTLLIFIPWGYDVKCKRFTPCTYSHRISRLCRRHKIPHWHPHQLRHGVATRVRRSHGIETARVLLGHATLNVTEIYAERDLQAAIDAANEVS